MKLQRTERSMFMHVNQWVWQIFFYVTKPSKRMPNFTPSVQVWGRMPPKLNFTEIRNTNATRGIPFATFTKLSRCMDITYLD